MVKLSDEAKRYFATMRGSGELGGAKECFWVIYSDSNTFQGHFNAVEYVGELREDIREQMRRRYQGVENTRVICKHFSSLLEAQDYCKKHNFIVL